jgi:hypothetical protein
MTALRSIACVLVCAIPVGACLDLSPVPYEGPDSGSFDGSLVSVVSDGGGPDAPGVACEPCFKTKCASAESACEQNAKCATLSTCLTGAVCWGSSLTNLSNLPPCLVQCAISSGVLGQDDPASVLAGALFSCADDPSRCASACGVAVDQ